MPPTPAILPRLVHDTAMGTAASLLDVIQLPEGEAGEAVFAAIVGRIKAGIEAYLVFHARESRRLRGGATSDNPPDGN